MTDRRPQADDVIATARRVCTPSQLEAVELYEAGYSHRIIARRLKLAPTTIRDRLDRAYTRIEHELNPTPTEPEE